MITVTVNNMYVFYLTKPLSGDGLISILDGFSLKVNVLFPYTAGWVLMLFILKLVKVIYSSGVRVDFGSLGITQVIKYSLWVSKNDVLKKKQHTLTLLEDHYMSVHYETGLIYYSGC